MSDTLPPLPQVGDPAPAFMAESEKGIIQFPSYSEGCWCILFAHPANFTSAMKMYSTFLALKERCFDERNTRLIALSNEPLHHGDWSLKVRRYIGIFLKAPVIEDIDFRIANLYGMALGRRKNPAYNRVAFIIDPAGIIRLIVDNLQPSIEHAILLLEYELDRLQGKICPTEPATRDLTLIEVAEESDASTTYKSKPAYFRRDKISPN